MNWDRPSPISASNGIVTGQPAVAGIQIMA
jgi:hypothetical protein